MTWPVSSHLGMITFNLFFALEWQGFVPPEIVVHPLTTGSIGAKSWFLFNVLKVNGTQD